MSTNGPRALWQRILLEAMTAASALIDEEMRKDFVVVRGSALVQHGSDRKTMDVDIAITPQTLNTFYERARSNPQFSLHSDGQWAYTCQGSGVEGLIVEFEFLIIGGEFAHEFSEINKFGLVSVASLPDIAAMKAKSYNNRREHRDFLDLLYALRKMNTMGITLTKIKPSAIRAIELAVGCDRDGELLLSQVMG